MTASPVGGAIEPMYASVGAEIPHGRIWTFEPKYDGVRVLAHVTPKRAALVTRNGNDKARQFPEIAESLVRLAQWVGHAFVIDGELVALVRNSPARFQALQGRMHLKGKSDVAREVTSAPSALIAFDALLVDDEILLDQPWTVRRLALKTLLSSIKRPPHPESSEVARRIRLAPSVRTNGTAMVDRAKREGWEGIIAKRTDALYEPGVRSDAWRKLKIEFRQEFVIGGFTEPRKTRQHIGALLLGYFNENGQLVYVGHTGGGFTHAGLAEMRALLAPLARKTSPFVTPPHTNEPATWVRPKIVVEVKFSEWTDDNRLRQPIYLGTRDDKDAREVTRESISVQRASR